MDTNRLLQVIDNISTKLAIAQDTQLEPLLNEYLPKLLNLLVMEEAQVRQKLMNALTIIRRRILANETIQFEFAPLLKLYLIGNSFLTNFSKLFMEIAFARCKTKSQLWNVLLDVYNDDQLLLGYILECMTHVTDFSHDVSKIMHVWQGILMKPGNFNQKLSILKYLKESNLPGNVMYPMLIVSAMEDEDRVSVLAQDILKKSFVDWNEILINKCFELYLDKVDKPSEKLKCKLLNSLMNSPISASKVESIDVIHDAFFAESASVKLKGLGLQYFLFFVEKTDIKEPKTLFVSLMSQMSKRDRDDYYLALGVFLKKYPKMIDVSGGILKMFFEGYGSTKNKIALTQGLYSFLTAISNPGKEEEEFLLDLVSKKDPNTIQPALYCANQLFPFSNVSARLMNLYCVENNESSRGIDIASFLRYRQLEKSELQDYPAFDKFVPLLHDKRFIWSGPSLVAVIQFIQNCGGSTISIDFMNWIAKFINSHTSTVLMHEIAKFLLSNLNLDNFAMTQERLESSLLFHIGLDPVARILATFHALKKKPLDFNVTEGSLLYQSWYIYYHLVLYKDMPELNPKVLEMKHSAAVVQLLGKMALSPIYRERCIKRLQEFLETEKKEQIIQQLGYLSNLTDYQVLIDTLFKYSSDPAQELQFTIGESIALIFSGESCLLYPKYFLNRPYESNQEIQLIILKRIMEESGSRTKASRFASCVYLLSLVRYGVSDLFDTYATEIQKAFLVFLSDKNSVTQEIACKGLTIFYDMSSCKDRLIQSLVSAFSGRPESDPLQLFKDRPNISLSSYKDLMSVANEIGKPDMIYQFLAYTSQNIILKGSRTKFTSLPTTIAPEMVPKIYRYSFDTNPLIGVTMKEMWTTLEIKIDPHIDAIMKDLMIHVQSSDHKVRLSTCVALMGVFEGRVFIELSEYLAKLFPYVWRVMDDMKDESRRAAIQLSERLGAFLIKSCDPSFAKHVDKSLAVIVPILMDGLVFSADIVRAWTLDHLQKILMVCGNYVKPFVAKIMMTLLENISSLEPSQLNYLQNMLGSEDKQVNEQIERIKSELVSSNPIFQCTGMLEKYLDIDLVGLLIPKMLELLKGGIGASTRQGTAKLLSMMISVYPSGVKPHCKATLKVIFQTLHQPIPNTEKSILIKCVPKLIPLGKVSDVKMIISDIVELFKAKNPISGTLTMLLVSEMFSTIQPYFQPLIPIIFIARFDENETIQKVWTEVWTELSYLNFETVYNKLLISECDLLMDNSNWSLKKQGVLAFKDLAANNKKNEEYFALLETNLKRQYFPGKEFLLSCVAQMNFPIITLLMGECAKNTPEYKVEGLKALVLAFKTQTIDDAQKCKDFLTSEWSKAAEAPEVRKLLIRLLSSMYKLDQDWLSKWILEQLTNFNTSEVLELINSFANEKKFASTFISKLENHDNLLVRDAIKKLM